MGLFEAAFIISAAAATILTVLFCCLIVHIKHNNKDKWLLRVVSLFLTSQIAQLVNNFATAMLFFWSKVNSFTVTLASTSLALYWLAINLSHYCLAQKYQELATKVPAILNNQVYEETSCEITVRRTLLVNIIASSFVYGFALVEVFTTSMVKDTDPAQWLRVMKTIGCYWVALCAIALGV